MSINPLINSTKIAHLLLENKIKNSRVVVDATMGNGYDTLFLCQNVLPKGIVYAFDIQETAVNHTLKLLKDHGYSSELESEILCIKDSHENFDKYILESVDVFMYNLGYLPGGDKSIVTLSRSTIKSLQSAFSLLNVGGIVSIIIYYRHPGGGLEKQAVENYLENLSNHEFRIFQGSMPYNDHCPPIIYMIEKLR